MTCNHLEATPDGIIIDKRYNIHYRYVKDLVDDTGCEKVCGANKCRFISILENRADIKKPKPIIQEYDKEEETLQERKRIAGRLGKRK